MAQLALYVDRLMSERSTTLFQAVHARDVAPEEYAQLFEEVLDSDMVFFLRNSYLSLAHTEGSD